jgi:hypothetical protein
MFVQSSFDFQVYLQLRVFGKKNFHGGTVQLLCSVHLTVFPNIPLVVIWFLCASVFLNKDEYKLIVSFYFGLQVYNGRGTLEEGETAEARFIKIQAAYELLIDADRRKLYDMDNRVNPMKVILFFLWLPVVDGYFFINYVGTQLSILHIHFYIARV